MDSYTRQDPLEVSDKISLWISKWYMVVIIVFLGIYVTMPVIAPILHKANKPGVARIIYAVYSPLCHQLPYRSFFIYGLQPFYPRALAQVDGYATFEQIFRVDNEPLTKTRHIDGSEAIGAGNGHAGYKMTICERDFAIYLSLFLFGLFFQVTGKKIKTLPWLLWLLFGLVPIALDGGSQLPAMVSFLKGLGFARESSPLLRVITGTLFGTLTGWYLFPMIAESMKETRQGILYKLEPRKPREN